MKSCAKRNTIAAALRYDAQQLRAPTVSASGRGELASTIGRVARRYAIPSVNDRELAENLSELDNDSEIPENLYYKVARLFSESV